METSPAEARDSTDIREINQRVAHESLFVEQLLSEIGRVIVG